MGKKRKQKPWQLPPVTADIERMDHSGRGICQHEGRTVFVEGALPGEQVVFQYVSLRAKTAEAKMVELLKTAHNRIVAKCPHFELCGGCSLQHLATSDQLAFKQNMLLELLAHFGKVKPEALLPALSCDQPWGYRRKARLGVRYVEKKQKVLVGFREKHHHFLADLSSCQVLIEQVGLKLSTLQELLLKLECRAQIPQIEVAAGDEAVALVVRHLTPISAEDLDKLVQFCQAHDFQLYLQPKGPDTIHRVHPQTSNSEQERLSYQLPDFGLTLQFKVSDFVQVNAAMNRNMIAQALALLQPKSTDRVLDLFCGLGNFTLPLATLAQQVIGVEGSEAMVQRGFENAAHNKIDNVAFYAADLSQSVEQYSKEVQPWYFEQFDLILLDPARSGALELVQQIARFKARAIVYVSCNPATLARDAGVLAEQGYQLKQAGVVDMFPHTAHVESIALFTLA